MKWLKNILFFGILLGLALPLVQQQFNVFEEKPLSGAYNLPDTVPLTSENWFSGEFQNLYSPFYEYEIGFRPTFIRVHNQLHKEIYHKSTNYVVMGQEEQLFAWNYWAPFWGIDYIGKDSIQERTRRIVKLKHELDSMGVPMMVIIGANKARIIPEYLPKNYTKEERKPNNYRDFIAELQQYDIKLVDFNEVFEELKPELGRMLFPNTGTHWSAYGMGLCLDSITSYANRMSRDTLRQARVTGYFEADSTVGSDLDLANDLNLLWEWKRKPNLFPKIEVTKQGRKAKIFAMGDSFYWNLYQLDDFYEVADSGSHYWYYNNTDITFESARTPVEEFNSRELIAQSDIVVLIATEANLNTFPFEFVTEFFANQGNKTE